MPYINLPPIKNDDDATPELFNSRFGEIADVINGGLDSANLANGAVTTEKLADGSITLGKMAAEADWQPVTYKNSWVDYDTNTWYGFQYYKDSSNIVHMRGLARGGASGSVICTLPAGYRPNVRLLFASLNSDVVGRVDILANGDIIPTLVPAGGWVTAANLTFRADQ